MDGRSVRETDLELVLERNGYPETCYFDFTYTPIIDEQGAIPGTLSHVTETSRKSNARQIEKLSDRIASVNEELMAANEELVKANQEISVAQHELNVLFSQLEES